MENSRLGTEGYEEAMTNYQRFQICSAAEQNLFSPDSPVWVSRYQLSRDQEERKLLLQVRMVNRSEKTIRQVFLRIRCLDGLDQPVTELELVPMPALTARPGQIFGEDKLTEITPAGTVRVEVFAQRVRFADGSAWDENAAAEYIGFAKPVKMQPEDPYYDELSRRAVSGGVRARYYYHDQRGLWTCTCGLPNGSRDLRCAHCGAERIWLEKHMDPALLEAPAQIPPVVPTPAGQPGPAEVYLYYPTQQPVPEPQPAPEETPAAKPRKRGKTTAIVLSSLILVVAAAFVGYLFLKPYLRYRTGLDQLKAGNYEEAKAIFEELGDYRDSAKRVQDSIVQNARAAMTQGDYQKAMDLLKDMPDQQKYVADCLYSLGVLAYNDGDLDTAWSYVRQLEERFPDYENLPQLKQYCCYSYGGRYAAQAAQAQQPEDRIEGYNQAMQWYAAAGEYEDSGERVTECSYRIAVEKLNMGSWEEAMEDFRLLGDYKQSAQYLADCKFRYAEAHIENTDQTTLDYLQELADANYEGAQELLDRLTGDAFGFNLTLGPGDSSGQLVQASDLSEVYLHYRVDSSDERGAVLILVQYTLPDGRQGRGLLNNDRSSTGTKVWTDLFPGDCRIAGPITLTFYDSERGEVTPLQTLTFQFDANSPAAGEQNP